MRHFTLILFLCFLSMLNISGSENSGSLKMLQINIWLEGTAVDNGFEDIVNIILQTDPDLVTISEVENYKDTDFIGRLCDSLSSRGRKYYGRKCFDSGLISRFPISSQTILYPWKDDQGSITKAKIEIGKRHAVLYSVHLDYKYYGPYLPRGYDGFTWKKLPSPVSDPERIMKFNDSSKRISEIDALISDASAEENEGNLVFIGGDFNEPSHLDWVSQVKDLYDHQGLVISWHCTEKLESAGFIDAYRKKYPDPVTHPGFTYPSDNVKAPIKKLAWAPDADDRDRIDFIFYPSKSNIMLKNIFIVGPSRSVVRGERVDEKSQDRFILPEKGWPSDHKGILAIFNLN